MPVSTTVGEAFAILQPQRQSVFVSLQYVQVERDLYSRKNCDIYGTEGVMKRPHGAYGDKTATQRAVEHRSNAARYMASTLCMMASMNIYEDHSDWIKSLAADSTITGTAEMINVAPSTLTRYLKRNNNKLSADYIIRISLAYGKDPLLSLVKTGKVPPEYMDAKPPTAEEKKQLLREMFEALDNQ